MQHFGLFGVLGHALHLGLHLFGGERLAPIILEGLRIEQIVFNLLFYFCCWHDRAECRFGVGSLSRPGAMAPINFFDGPLISDAIGKGKLPSRQRMSSTWKGFGEEASGVCLSAKVNRECHAN